MGQIADAELAKTLTQKRFLQRALLNGVHRYANVDKTIEIMLKSFNIKIMRRPTCRSERICTMSILMCLLMCISKGGYLSTCMQDLFIIL